MKKFFKGLFKFLAWTVGIVLLLAVLFIGYLTLTEYDPDPIETLTVEQNPQTVLDKDRFTVLSLNVGYCALGRESEFFMDGGKEVRPDSKQIIDKNYAGLLDVLRRTNADFTLLQEVDAGSKRSYQLDQVAAFTGDLGLGAAYAINYQCPYVPFPWPPIGKVESGLLTLSGSQISEAKRHSLPCPFSWPVSAANLKRCLLVSRVPLAGSDRELVLVNLHLEAYDDGEGKIAQTNQLLSLLADEYAKGNYVIAGGDFNQIFPDSESLWPNTHRDLWTPGVLNEDELGEGWALAWDASHPTCRLLNQPYDPSDTENTQYYVIDGFLVSPNVQVESTQTLDEDFAYTDHNPVLLTVSLKP